MAGPAAVAPARRRPAATASAPAWRFPSPAALVAEAIRRGHRRRTRHGPVAAGTGGVAAAGGARRGRRRAVVRRAARPPRPPPRTGAAAGRAVRHLRRPPPRAAAGLAAGGSGDVDADLAWQPELWRRLRARIGGPDPAERVEAACAALRADPGGRALPARLSLFGPTRLAAQELAVLARAGRAPRRCTCGCPTPPPRSGRKVAPCGVPRARADPSADAARHPLLSSLGRDVRELQVRLTAAVPGLLDHHHPRPEPPATLLGRLQRELRDDRPPEWHVVPAADRQHRAGARLPRARPPGRGAARGRARAAAKPIPRSSRATSWSCAPTSRRSRR